MSKFYHEGNWYPMESMGDLVKIIRECFSEDLAAQIEAEHLLDYPEVNEAVANLELERDAVLADQIVAQDQIEALNKQIDRVRPELDPDLEISMPAHRLKASVPVHIGRYNGYGEAPYEKYSCPVCRLGGIRIGLVPPRKNRYSNCPCCHVRLDWYETLGEDEAIPF